MKCKPLYLKTVCFSMLTFVSSSNLGDSTVSSLMKKKMSRNRKVKKKFSGAKIKDMFHYVIFLLEKKP